MFARVIVIALFASLAAAFQRAPSTSSSSALFAGAKSKSLPFLPQPPALTGLAGDVGELIV